MTARYAVYHAPPRHHLLTVLASAWLGHDAWTGAPVARPVINGLEMDEAEVDALTAEPRHYGFHGTLKAPFSLASGQTEAALVKAFLAFSAAQNSFEADLVVKSLSGFIALTLAHPSDAMAALHAACVVGFEPFRAPLSDTELARRRRAPLTAVQDSKLVTFGYPWIFEDFRFHMTLTARVSDPEQREVIREALTAYLAAGIGPTSINTLCLFRQEDRQAPFRILASSALRDRS